jgi:hypothetical protein
LRRGKNLHRVRRGHRVHREERVRQLVAGGMLLRPCHDPSTARAGVQKPRERKNRFAPVGMTNAAYS